MDKKYGVYICTGCGIGDALDIEALSGVAEEEGLPVIEKPGGFLQAATRIKQEVRLVGDGNGNVKIVLPLQEIKDLISMVVDVDDDFRDARQTLFVGAGNEELYSFSANVMRLFVSFWY